MKIELHVEPRQNGKTTKLIEEYMSSNVNESIYITSKQTDRSIVQDKIRELGGNKERINNVLTIRQFVTSGHLGRSGIKTIFIDEWFYFNENDKWDFYRMKGEMDTVFGVERIVIRSTSDKLYNLNEIKIVRFANMKSIPYTEMRYLLNKDSEKGLVYNFLGDNDCTIYNETVMRPMDEESKQMSDLLGFDRYLVERCGWLYK